ncbi:MULTISPECIES: dicarboxylate/amino acid:cation symporter [Methylobacterium]|jgi:Na+/H+-dicarboxylate symporter|uniref:dicarboxylate/amino acid:cation symporter n=2 Tax=Methylobacteriaceae TaxID=119045 RepID=UPI00039DB11D|nr:MULTISPECIES: dicarboxylate/amino acid:cation symporter [Methylobacterium]KQS50433.1 C4-dicarboxylate ABC transporter [Methylobacterium sp. Leaf361]MBN4095808.1 dicarboxylate/amino acid:cation symporter [Methylobacterium sp. OT2]UIN37180.1 dicarboxylate/amino acid:cation symporter [Methylobacterium oryzae]SEG36994.1 Na+/H+-dicarboxylate symporter [Methylobacterium sp. 190mf]SEH73103.1 Na+/H+-dicarboxylate symporter [Methylobacterium sp. 275MFSha3.1]
MAGSRLTTMIFIGMLLGIAVGYACSITWPDPQTAKEIAGYIALVSDVFLRLIKMIIAPLVFSTLVVGIAHLGDTASVGRVGGKALLWFVGASFCSLMLGLIMVNLMQPGHNLNLPLPDAGAGTGLKAASLSLKEFVTHLVPKSAVEAMANNEILQIVVFSIFFGVGLAALGEKGRLLAQGIEGIADVMLKVTGYVMMFAPVAVFAAIAATITTQGIGVLVTYGKFLVEFYISLGVLWTLLMGVGFLLLGGGGIMRLFNLIKEPFVLAFSTASSEAAYPKMLSNLEKFGVPNRITSFVLPMGYSFNLDGSMMYCTFAVMFIAQAYNIPLSWGQQLTMLLLLMVTSKGMAGVPRASLVVISATLSHFNIPEAGLLLIIGIDQFLDMGRSATNVLGNSVATVAVAKWEGQLSTTDQRLDHVGTVASPAE